MKMVKHPPACKASPFLGSWENDVLFLFGGMVGSLWIPQVISAISGPDVTEDSLFEISSGSWRRWISSGRPSLASGTCSCKFLQMLHLGKQSCWSLIEPVIGLGAIRAVLKLSERFISHPFELFECGIWIGEAEENSGI